jgi:hypothetical protein
VGRESGGVVSAKTDSTHASGDVRESLGVALLKAFVILLLAFVGFAIIPDRLVAYLSLHVTPRVRDSLVTLWVAVYFVFLTWLFVRLQPTSGTVR